MFNLLDKMQDTATKALKAKSANAGEAPLFEAKEATLSAVKSAELAIVAAKNLIEGQKIKSSAYKMAVEEFNSVLRNEFNKESREVTGESNSLKREYTVFVVFRVLRSCAQLVGTTTITKRALKRKKEAAVAVAAVAAAAAALRPGVDSELKLLVRKIKGLKESLFRRRIEAQKLAQLSNKEFSAAISSL